MSSMTKLILALTTVLGIGLTIAPATAAPRLRTEANVMVEFSLAAKRGYADSFNTVTLDVVFTDPQGHEFRVPAFWDGGKVWKVRYASPIIGTHRFHSECSEAKDKGLNGITGKVEVKPYTGSNPLYLHGPIHVAADHRHFEQADGTPFFWLGDTWWMGLSGRLHWPADFRKLTADRKEKGFNVIQIVAGLFPDMHPFDPRGANEAGYPWMTNYTSINPRYFDEADKRFTHLVDQGFMPCIVGAWGYFLPWMGVDKAKAHWRYLIARYGAMPVVWCTAGEANLPWYLAKNFPYDDRQQVKGWTEVTRYLRATDPFHRLITIHPTGIGRLSARHAMDDLSLIDIDMLQTPHGQRDAVAPTVHTMRESYADHPVMPVINGEASFEMLGDSLPTQWTRRMFWLCLMNGAAGHTYGANGIWQVNRRGDPHGPSPTAGSTGYGKISWDEAMNLPGSAQVALGKKLFEQYPWQNFQPHPEWATLAEAKPSLNLEGGQWIWFPEGNPAQDAPAGKRFFRKHFVIPDGKQVRSAQLRLAVDDRFSARLNGEEIGTSSSGAESWRTGKQFNNLASRLKTGTNVLAILAENMPTTGQNPAGLIARLEIQFEDGGSLTISSDDTWHAMKSEVAGWDAITFDDTLCEQAKVVAKYGEGPWGRLNALSNDEVYGPQSAGIPGIVRITYVPDGEPILVKNLGSDALLATYFDPVTGAKTKAGPVHAGRDRSWTCNPPENVNHDWVLVLEEKSKGEAR